MYVSMYVWIETAMVDGRMVDGCMCVCVMLVHVCICVGVYVCKYVCLMATVM